MTKRRTTLPVEAEPPPAGLASLVQVEGQPISLRVVGCPSFSSEGVSPWLPLPFRQAAPLRAGQPPRE